MKYVIAAVIFLVSGTALSATECKPTYEAPARLSVWGHQGQTTLYVNALHASGNRLSPVQPSQRFKFVAGTFKFFLTPISSCDDGLLLELKKGGVSTKVLVPWGQKEVISGQAESNNYIAVSAKKAKP